MTKKSGTTTDAVEIVHRRLYEGKPQRLKGLEEARANDEIARKIFGLRTKAGLTQAQLGKLIGTTASVICRLEDADYEGHSLAMLRRIAAALIKSKGRDSLRADSADRLAKAQANRFEKPPLQALPRTTNNPLP
jgi:transcriptional regulator with XRE-family HTH domain